MIKTIVKRNGEEQEFSPTKLNGWSEWASKTLGKYVDWPTVVFQTVSVLPEICSSQLLQKQLIKTCLDNNSWSYNRMAGRLYAALTYKELYGDKIPTVKELHQELVQKGYMVELGYSDDEYTQIEKIINHKLDFKASYYELQHIRKKYSIKDVSTGTEYESQQFVYMRMAMALAADEPETNRMKDVENWYNHLSQKRINAPTPNFVNLGTPLRGFASCCVINSKDTAKSLATTDHIAYMMTCMSAGIGVHHGIRSINDPVRGGRIKHMGKLPYYRALNGAVHANMQAGRGGACTVYYSAFDPEVDTIAQLKNPMSTEDKKIRGMDYAFSSNRFFAKKAAKNEEVFLFNCFTAPDLWDSMYSGDPELFEKLYNKYDKNKVFKKTYVNARELLLTVLNEAYETGRAYLYFPDESNTHTPFKDKIYSSNLCVAGYTYLRLRDKETGKESVARIDSLKDTYLNYEVLSYNTETKKNEWKPILNWYLTNSSAKTVQVCVWCTAPSEMGDSLIYMINCTEDHQIFTRTRGYVKAKDLQPNDLPIELADYSDEGLEVEVNMDSLVDPIPVYDIVVADNHNFYANDILVHNCTEIELPTHGYDDMSQLYSDQEEGNVHVSFDDGSEKTYLHNDYVSLVPGYYNDVASVTSAFALKVGQSVPTADKRYKTITKVIVDQSPEIGLCSLAGICVDHIGSDEEYEDAMYYALKMIDRCIDLSDYVLPNLGVTAKARRSAGVGIVGLAHYMASRHLSYSSQEGRDEIHRLAEKHMYFAIKASLRLGRQLGNAPWIGRTKWPDGWLPIDTYNKNVDQASAEPLHFDWEQLRKEIVDNGGIRHSVLIAHMPSESSSLASGTSNGLYPIRSLTLLKGDASKITYWAAPDGERLSKWYDIAWQVPSEDLIKIYGIIQKFTDQGISADLFADVSGGKISSSNMIREYLNLIKYGLKSRYYMNTLTTHGIKLSDKIESVDVSVDESQEYCESCTL